MKLLRTNSENPEFQKLAYRLEEELRIRDGDEQEFYATLNQIGKLAQALVAFEQDLPVGCGALRSFNDDCIEIKRMYVEPGSRGKSYATAILLELEKWASEIGYNCLVLETGRNQPEAIALYEKNGYRQIPRFGRYLESGNSICFKKIIPHSI
jgi:GNAT superfamily N-acetyltransferase